MNRREFLKFLAATAISPLVNACARLLGYTAEAPTALPTVTASPAIAPSPTASPSPTATSISPTAAPTPDRCDCFRLHPFIEAHPEAVFIKRTHVSLKTDGEAKQQEGFQLAQEIFVFGTGTGIPLSHKIAIKANLTCTQGKGNTVAGMGIITDRYFMEGLIDGMLGLGFRPENMYMREGNWLGDGYCPQDLSATGYVEMARRTGIHLLDFPSGRHITELTVGSLQEGTEVIWKDCPQGAVFKRIGYVAPHNQADTWLLNVAKFKAHSVGMTLCAKNLQGMCVSPYIHFCESAQKTSSYPVSILKDFQPAFVETVAALHKAHVEAGIPRWDRPGVDRDSGYGMELWAQRTCDSLSVTQVGLCIIEGIYGRNGNGFMGGPGAGGKAQDFMSNLLVFGKDPWRVDIIGTWLAGHEPGNFGLFHIANERGLSDALNPREIPVYLWEGGKPQPASLNDFERVPLKCTYLRRNYNNQDEPKYHLVNESFDY